MSVVWSNADIAVRGLRGEDHRVGGYAIRFGVTRPYAPGAVLLLVRSRATA
jgi:hypothetical protein